MIKATDIEGGFSMRLKDKVAIITGGSRGHHYSKQSSC